MIGLSFCELKMDENIYKFWLIQYLDMVNDVNNIIQRSLIIYERVFKLPHDDQFINNNYVNPQGIVFNKIKDRYMLVSTKHMFIEAELHVINEQILDVQFYCRNNLHHYDIDFKKSNIHKLTMVKQDCLLRRCINNRYCVYVTDPTLIAI